MRATTLLALLLCHVGCGRIGYDALVQVVPGTDGATGGDGAPGDRPGPVGDGPAAAEVDSALDAPAEGAGDGPADGPAPDLVPDRPPDVRPPDVRPPDAPPVDTLVPMDLPPDMLPPLCTEPFSPPALVSITGVSGDLYAPRLTADGLTLYFGEQASMNPNSVDLRFATRTAVGGAFAPAQPLVEANSGSEDNGAFLTADRLELFFFSGRPGGAGGRDIWVLRRSAPTAPWDAPRVVTELNSSNDDYMPSLTGDGLTIFFASNRIGRSDDIWTASRASRTAPFSVPATVAELSSLPTPATSPFIARDGLTLLFADERPGGQGARDLWTTTRASPTAPFANPTNLGALFNSAAIDDDPSLSFDGRELFFASDRVAADSRIYRAIRCP